MFSGQRVTKALPGVGTTLSERSGRVFLPIGRQGEAGGLEDAADLTFDPRAGDDSLTVLLDGRLLQPIEVARQVGPFDGDTGGLAAVGQLLLQHQGVEGAEDMAADRPVT